MKSLDDRKLRGEARQEGRGSREQYKAIDRGDSWSLGLYPQRDATSEHTQHAHMTRSRGNASMHASAPAHARACAARQESNETGCM